MKRLKYLYGEVWYRLANFFEKLGMRLIDVGLDCAHEGALLQADFMTEKHRKHRQNLLGQES